MTRRRVELIRLIVPIAVTVLLELVFFAVFDRWNKLADPINSAVTVAIALAVVAVSVAFDIDRMNNGRPAAAPPAAPDHH